MEVDEAEYTKLKNAVVELQGMVEELMAFKVQHVGYDVAAQVGYVHPTQKILMAEFGRGNSRVDVSGMQVLGNSARGIWFINPDFGFFDLERTPAGVPQNQQYSYMFSNNMFATYRADLAMRVATAGATPRSDFSMNTYSTQGADIQIDARSTGFHAQVFLFTVPNPGGAAYVSIYPALNFSFETSDTANTGTFYEGDMLYRSDLKKLRFNDGAAENVAMESWVTAGFIASGYANSMLLMGA